MIFGGSWSGSSRTLGSRSRTALMPVIISARATCIPMQVYVPPPKPNEDFAGWVKSNSSGLSQRAGSRLAAPRLT